MNKIFKVIFNRTTQKWKLCLNLLNRKEKRHPPLMIVVVLAL
ncbi:hypothetical protein H1D07_11945 [Mannheimia haemolytica]|nr:hypothetical protein H1D07_11945 [Mannheimia haemolytica]ULX42601.1 hypothetical protein H1D02_05915 [Mannheimia haemolytica]